VRSAKLANIRHDVSKRGSQTIQYFNRLL